jgi:hypothetical protein
MTREEMNECVRQRLQSLHDHIAKIEAERDEACAANQILRREVEFHKIENISLYARCRTAEFEVQELGCLCNSLKQKYEPTSDNGAN